MDPDSGSHASCFRFSDLPQDVGRTIFELLAEDSIPNGLTCAVVSKKVQSWVEPIVYRSVTLLGTLEAECFLHAIDSPTSTKPPDFFARHVKFLVVNFCVKVDHISTILLKCTGIQTLVCWLIEPVSSSKVWGIVNSFHRPTRLSVRLSPLPDGPRDFSSAVFQNLTRLEIVSDDGADWRWSSLVSLKRLTHLSLNPPPEMAPQLLHFVKTILDSCCPPNLRVLVVFFSPEFQPSGGLHQMIDIDARVVFAIEDADDLPEDDVIARSMDDLVLDWAGRSVGTDFWTQAEEIIQSRRLAAE